MATQLADEEFAAERAPRPGRPQQTPVVPMTVLLVGIGLLVLGNGLQGTLLSVRAKMEGMADETVGLMMSAYFAGYLGGSILAPRLIERAGHIRTFAALASIASAVALAYILLISSAGWVLLRAIQGTCFAGLVVVAESWLNSGSSREGRGRVLSTYSAVLLGGWGVSHLLLNINSPSGFVLFCVVSMLLSLSLVPVTLSRVTSPDHLAATRMGMRRLLRVSPQAVAGAFVVGLTLAAVVGMGPVFAKAVGLDTLGVSLFMATLMGGALLLQWPMGWVSDAVDRRKVILVASLAAAVAAFGLARSVDAAPERQLVLAFFLGAFALPIYPVCIAHVNDWVSDKEYVAAAGGLVLVYGLGSLVGPFSASLLMGQIGPSGLFWFIGTAHALYVAFGLYRMTQRVAVARALKRRFLALPHTLHGARRHEDRDAE